MFLCSLSCCASLQATPDIHGILGQTYRADESRSIRAVEYQLLTKLLQGPLHVDTPVGVGYLDGKPEDYETSASLAADCRMATAWQEA